MAFFYVAEVAELVDAHDSNSCEGNFMRVRFPPSAQILLITNYCQKTDVMLN